MRILFISDTHTFHKELKDLPQADVICSSGDLCLRGEHQEGLDFMQWLSQLDYPHKIFTPGNHDICFDQSHPRFSIFQKNHEIYEGEWIEDMQEKVPEEVHLLMQSGVEIDGIKFWGAPQTPWFHNWAFNIERNSAAMESIWAKMPEDTDVLLSHGPPFGVLDLTIEGLKVGCESLAARLETVKPPIINFGHIHESYGFKLIEYIGSDKTTLAINSSVVNRRYWVINKPVLVNYDKSSGKKEIIVP